MIAETTNGHQCDIAIVGGGIGGLCLAIGLSKYPHINVHIYEAAHRFEEIGAGVTVGPNAQRALKLLDPSTGRVLEQQSTGNGPDFPALKNVFCRYRWGAGPKSGNLIGDAWCDNGQQSVHRAKFLDELVKLVDLKTTHFNKRLTKLEQTDGGCVTLYFKDGTTATADCVVGADGVHSTVRKHFVPEDHASYHPSFTGMAAYRGLLAMKEAQATLGSEATQVATLYVAQGSMIMTYPVDFGNVLNIVAVNMDVKKWDGPSVQPADLEEMNRRFAGWSGPGSKVVTLLNRPETKIWSLWQLPPLPAFINSRVVLMGDAAHATTPFLGQGAGQAIEDALVLSNLLGSVEQPSDLSYALHAFDRIRKPRSQKVVRTSREAGEMFGLRLPGVLDDEEAFRKDIEDRTDWIFNRDMQLQVNQALMMVEELKVVASQTK